MNWLENKYTYLVGGRCRNFKRVSDTVYNFSCPICGDSRRHPRKARGYITSRGGNVWYTCHKCGASMPFHRFVEAVDPSMYADYLKERVVAGLWKRTPDRAIALPVRKDTETIPTPSVTSPGDPLSPLLRVDALPPGHRAREMCEARKIPDLSRLFHCPRFYAWSNYVLKRDKFKKEALHFDHPRLIIPFVEDGVLTAYQGRDYDPDSDNKYVTIRIDESKRPLYGLDRLEPGTAYALEGPIDAMFIHNGIAFAGGDHRVLERLDKRRLVVVYDNEPRSAHTVKKVALAIRDGYRVCIWPRHVVQKDVNDMVLAGLDPRAVIDSRTFSGLEAELELSAWGR